MPRSSHLVDPTQAWGHRDGALSYAQGRPSYPAAALRYLSDRLGLDDRHRVADVGAGTGKFTEQLASHLASFVVGIEPQHHMRAVLSGGANIAVVGATAEHLPLAPASLDAAFAATSFHWFDHDRAVPELHRVLVAGGGLGLIWMERDESVPWVKAMTDIIRWDSYRPYGTSFDWAPVLESGGLFDLVERRQFAGEQWLDRQGFADRVRSISYIAALAPAEREALVDRSLSLVSGFAEPFALPYVCDVVVALAR